MSKHTESTEFYVGYLGKAPAGLRRFMRRIVVLLLALGVAVAVLVVAAEKPFYPSVFEFMTYRTFEGTIDAAPYPALRVPRPDAGDSPVKYSRYHLVAPGKFGAQAAVAGLAGSRVRLQAALIYRDDQTMLELLPGSIRQVGETANAPAAPPRPLGEMRLTGEIVDSKCFLGVMNPGELKPHRACARLCISGGIPPVLVVRTRSGSALYFLLVSRHGRAVNQEVLDRVAVPVEISGEVLLYDDMLVLRADPQTYRMLE